MNNEIDIDIDLRRILIDLARSWKWILGAGLVAGLIALAVVLLSPDKYTATALIAITRPRYIANFDSRYVTLDPTNQENNSYMDLANSDEVIGLVFQAWDNPQKTGMRLEDFRGSVTRVTPGGDSSSIVLSVSTKDAKESARLANLWADEFVHRANSTYGSQDATQLPFFKKQRDQAQTTMDAAEKVVNEFAARDEGPILQNQLDALLATQADTLQKQKIIRQVQQDASSLLIPLGTLPPTNLISLDDSLSWTILRSRFYSQIIGSNSAQNTTTSQQAIQIQIPASSSSMTVGDQIVSIHNWVTALDKVYDSSQTALTGLNQQVTDLQNKITVLSNQRTNYKRNYDLAVETFTTLTRKEEEVSITLQNSQGDVRISANAIQPSRPVSRQILKVCGIAALLGASLCLAFIIIRKWLTNRL